MSDIASEGNHESRTQSIGTKRSLGNSSTRSRKRRRNATDKSHRQRVNSVNNTFAALSQQSGSYSTSSEDQVTSMPPTVDPRSSVSATASDAGLGRNRLASGFTKHVLSRESKIYSHVGDVTDGSKESGQATSDSPPSVIEISDDEMEESEGGMVINLDDRHATNASNSSLDDVETQESGEIESSPEEAENPRKASQNLFVIDSAPSLPLKRLCDLDSTEFEEQITYAFFHLDRAQIDTNRPVVCLLCMREGHLHNDCDGAGKDSQGFPAPNIDGDAQVKLWISCCVCASKMHLVGDCPRVHTDLAAGWSLKAIDPRRIVNLSLQSGTKRLEIEAANRNMRPAGLQIRGRAGMHRAGDNGPRGFDSSDDEPFLRKPVGRQNMDKRLDAGSNRSYDRHNTSSDIRPYRGGSKFYQTDSFGRRRSRSRSPQDNWDTYRPRGDLDSLHTSSQRDSRHRRTSPRRESYHTRFTSPPRQNGRAPTAASNATTKQGNQASTFQFSLPTRNGSHTLPQPAQSLNDAQLNGHKNGGLPSKKRKKGKRKGQAN